MKTVVQRDYGPGMHTAVWDGRNENGARVTTGVYFYMLQTPGDVASGKMIVRR